MARVLIFGGTAEGRALAQRRAEQGDEVLVCVTSEYARRLLPPGVRCRTGALDREGMLALIHRERPQLLIDATHPFARQASANIAYCARQAGVALARTQRPPSGAWRDRVMWAPSPQAALALLRQAPGNILLTTGSHTLPLYAAHLDPQRLYARVLPDAQVLSSCQHLLPPGHLIAMQGPFTPAFNGALYDMLCIRTLLSKDSGEAGGVSAKVEPALERNMRVILIARPEEEI